MLNCKKKLKVKNTFISIVFTTLISSFASSQFTIVDYKPCESLAGISTFVDQISPSNPMNWEVGTGYSGNGFAIIGNSYGGYIEYIQNFSGNSYIEFYCKAFQMGYPNRIPTFSIDGTTIPTTLLNSNVTGSYIKLRTDNISSGNHVVKIDFTHVSTYYQYYIDEITTYSDASSGIENPIDQYDYIVSQNADGILIQNVEPKSTYKLFNSIGQVIFEGIFETNHEQLIIDENIFGIHFIQINDRTKTLFLH